MPDIVIKPNQFNVQSRRSVVQVVQATTERTILAIAPDDGQTVFELPSTPTNPHLSGVFINGLKATYGIHYMINLSVLTWLGIGLEQTDLLEIRYQ